MGNSQMPAPPDSSRQRREQPVSADSPEARRREPNSPASAAVEHPAGMRWQALQWIGPKSRAFEVMRRTAIGTYQDGFIHAGNLAYLSMLAIFPFFILGGALFELIGGAEQSRALIDTVLVAMPPTVEQVIEPVANDVINARSGWLLWFGAAIALWTVSSLIETIRDILRRAYGTQPNYAFWKYRLFSVGIILGAVVLLMASLFAQVIIGASQQIISAQVPQLTEAVDTLRLSRLVPGLALFGSLFLLFYTLTPEQYRTREFPKWPGALLTAVWWLAVTTAMPIVLAQFFSYSLTYGSLAGIIIALLFFWLVGLGLVIGAELNAALAEPLSACESEGKDEIQDCDGSKDAEGMTSDE